MILRVIVPASLCLALAPSAWAWQETVEQRLDRLEQENAELRQRIDAVAGQVEQVQFGDVLAPAGESRFGMGEAASKVYAADSGLSLGGYGEGLFQSWSGPKASRADLLRAVLYTGFKFDEHWLFNSELEVEHASTEDGGEVALEFAYLEYLHSPALAVRAGLLLVPMGLVNEMHEPTTFYGTQRPEVERRILPSTWRENGVGVLGDLGDFSYRLFTVTGLDGTGFDASGLRDGRQGGAEAKAEDLAVTGRLDWKGVPGLVAGVAAFAGGAGQDTPGLGQVETLVLDVHAEYRWRGLRLRGLAAQATVADTRDLFAASGGTAVVGERMRGGYLEAGYDVMPLLAPRSGHELIPFVRYEALDTHDRVAAGLVRDPAQDEPIVTVGLHWMPLPNLVFKVDYQDFDRGPDRFGLGFGYVF